jgi:hypothetical protein
MTSIVGIAHSNTNCKLYGDLSGFQVPNMRFLNLSDDYDFVILLLFVSLYEPAAESCAVVMWVMAMVMVPGFIISLCST